MNETIHVENMAGLIKAFALADKVEAKLLRAELKLAAVPVKAAAEAHAITRIRRMGHSPQWAQMRLGLGRSIVYMVPKQKGRASRTNPRARRPRLKALLLERAMEPALAEKRSDVERRVQNVLDTVGRQWEQA